MDPTNVTASELARLFGIREDEPNLHLSIESDFNALTELDTAIQSANSEVLAEFFALHLPSLLNLLQNLPAQSSLGGMVLDVLHSGFCFRLPQVNVGLHRCPAARDLPRLIVKRLCEYPLDQLDNVTVAVHPTAGFVDEVFLPWTDLGVLLKLAIESVQFGPSSQCNYNLEASLLDALGTLGRHFLSTPFLEREDIETNSGVYFPGLKIQIMTLFTLFELPGGLVQIPEHIRTQNLAMLRCGQGESSEEGHRCQVLIGGAMCRSEQQEMMHCSKCLCVAYCSREHQKLDWKKHKPVCFRPSW